MHKTSGWFRPENLRPFLDCIAAEVGYKDSSDEWDIIENALLSSGSETWLMAGSTGKMELALHIECGASVIEYTTRPALSGRALGAIELMTIYQLRR